MGHGPRCSPMIPMRSSSFGMNSPVPWHFERPDLAYSHTKSPFLLSLLLPQPPKLDLAGLGSWTTSPLPEQLGHVSPGLPGQLHL